jgi:predicted dehydrogenase
MQSEKKPNVINNISRRTFIKRSGLAMAGVASVSYLGSVGYTAEDNTIKVALVGCGGRGTGAAENALLTKGPVKIFAMADVFKNRLDSSRQILKNKFGDKVDVSEDRCFVGFDGYKKAIDSIGKGGVVILATPPAFRPLHLEYAVDKGVHVFMEKSFAVDAPGIRRVLKAGERAKEKNLKIAGGLMSRHYLPLELAIQKIHEGIIGEVITSWAYRMHGPVGISEKQPGMSEMAYQIANYSCFTWLNGSFIVDWLIHNIDVCCWVKNSWPISVQGHGGRQVRNEPDQLFDHYIAEYTFADGTRMLAQGRHMTDCWEFFGDIIHGSKGSAILGEGIPDPKIYKGFNPTEDSVIWQFREAKPNPYQVEHDLLFDAIRNDKPYNETERCAKSCLTAIMGRMAIESGKKVSWDDAFNSQIELAPGIENFSFNKAPPVVPDSNGKYPIAVPGKTRAF